MEICVFGAASNLIDESYIKAVEKLGEIMGKRGHNLVFGAGANGLMGAAARSVRANGGNVFGVIPEFFREENVEQIFLDCDELVYTKTMAERKATMEDRAEAFIIVPGGIGTFEEMFQVLTLKQLGRHTKAITIFDVNGYYKKLEEFLHVSYSEKFLRNECRTLYYYSDDPEKIIDYIENYKQIKLDVHDLKNG